MLTIMLAGAGDLAEAARADAAGLARARDAGDLWNQAILLPKIVDLELRAGRTGDAAAHLREGLRLAVRTGSWLELRADLFQCGNLCAATGRAAEALTLWAACAAVDQPKRVMTGSVTAGKWDKCPGRSPSAGIPARALYQEKGQAPPDQQMLANSRCQLPRRPRAHRQPEGR